MKKSRAVQFILISLFFICSYSNAQLNSTSGLLLKSSKSSNPEEELNSDWFQVKKRNNKKSSRSPASVKKTTSKKKKTVKRDPQFTGEPITKKNLGKKLSEEKLHNKEIDNDQEVIEQLRDLMLGGTEEDIHKLKEKLHFEDPRKNMIFLNLAPTYAINNSVSNFWYRDYKAESPGFYFGAFIWFTPFIGIQSDFHSTLGADVDASPSDTSKIAADQQRLTVGVRFRNMFGISLKAPTLEWGLDYYENSFLVPKDAANRIRTKSTGMQIAFKATIPKSKAYAWLIESKFVPSLATEEEATGITVTSGNHSTSNMLSLSLGGQFLLDRRQQVFYKLEHQVEKNLYEGTTSVNDPKTGSTISGVSVQNNTTMFYLGYSWGH